MFRSVAARFLFQRVELSAPRIASVSACNLTLVTSSRIVADGEAATAAIIAGASETTEPAETVREAGVALPLDLVFSSRASIWGSRKISSFRIKFSSSRTLPGQWYAVIACLSSGVMGG